MTRRAASLIALLAWVGACGGETAEPTAEPSGPANQTSSPGGGVIEGVVRLAPGASLPAYASDPMAPRPGGQPIPDTCTAPRDQDRRPVTLGPDRGLAGVLVALHEFSTEPTRDPVTHEVAIRDCRLQPRLVVAMRGDRLRITNETDYPFFPDLGEGISRAVLHGRSREVELAQGGARSLGCIVTASCGRTEVVTLYHPLYAVTDENGRFRIEGAPANEEVQVSAWHPLFQEARTHVTLRTSTDPVELALQPAPSAPPPSPPTRTFEGPAEDHPDEILF